MSQEIQFYTTTILSDIFLSEFNGETNPFSSNNIYQCLKGLFQGTEKKSEEYVKKYFENVELDYLSISASELEKINKDFKEELKYLFDPQSNTFSFVNETLWSNLQTIIFDQSKKCFSNEDKKKSLDYNLAIMQDYKRLLDLFQKRVLFMVIF